MNNEMKRRKAAFDVWANSWFCIIEDENGKVSQTIYGSSMVDAEANAKLVEAAPDLLACCLAAKAMYEAQGITEKSMIGGEQYKDVLNAIKKATK